MPPRRDLLGEAVAPATHNYDALLVRIDHERPPFFGKAVRRGCGEWPGAESNCRHADFQSAALPTELPGRAIREKNLAGRVERWECHASARQRRQLLIDHRRPRRASLPEIETSGAAVAPWDCEPYFPPMPHPRFPNLTVLDHPLIQHKLTILRDKDTPTRNFKQLVNELAMLMAYEVTKDLALE